MSMRALRYVAPPLLALSLAACGSGSTTMPDDDPMMNPEPRVAADGAAAPSAPQADPVVDEETNRSTSRRAP